MDEYADVDELKADFLKLFNNALAYYKKGSPEHRDAMEMSDLFNKAFGKGSPKSFFQLTCRLLLSEAFKTCIY